MAPKLGIVMTRRVRGLGIAAFATLSVGATGSAIAIRLGGSVVDLLLDGRDAVALAVITTLLAVSAPLFNTVSMLFTTQLATSVAVGLRQRLVTHALALPTSFFTDRSVGEITNRISTDVDTVADGMVEQGQSVLWGLIGGVVAWIVAWTVNPWLAVAFLPVCALLAVVAARLGRPAAEASEEMEQLWSEAAGTAEEAFDGRSDLRQTLGRGLIMRRWAEHTAALWAQGSINIASRRRLSVSTVTILRGFQFGVVVVGSVAAINGRVTAGSVWVAFGLVRMFSSRIEDVISNLPRLSELVAAIVRVRDLLDEDPEPDTTVTAQPNEVRWAGPVDLCFNGVTFSYPDDPTAVLHEVKLDVPGGTTAAVVGRTGSGKSTLARLVSRTALPEPGTVFLDGVDVCAIPVHELRRHVSVITQRVELIRATVRDNVSLFDPSIDDRQVIAAFEELGLGPWIDSLPAGIDTVIAGDGAGDHDDIALSQGEAQLVSFARLLVRNPSVVILDEATAKLDPATEELARNATTRMLRGRTAIVIAHRLVTIADADLIVVMDHGVVAESGTAASLLEQPVSMFRVLVEAAGGDGALITRSQREPSTAPAGSGSIRRTNTSRDRRAPALTLDEGADSVIADVELGSAEADDPRPADVHRTTFPLVSTTLGLLRRHRRWSAPGLTGWYLWFLSPAIAAWTWQHLLEELQPGGSIVVPLVVLGASVVIATIGLCLGHTYFSRWWLLTETTMRSNLIAAQLHPTDRSTGRDRVAAGDAVSRLWDADSVIVYTDRFVDVFGSMLFIAAATAVSDTWSTLGWLLLPMVVPASLAWAMRRPISSVAIEHAVVKGIWTGRVAQVCAAATTIKGFAAESAVADHIAELTERRQVLAQRQRGQSSILRGSVLFTAAAGQQLILLVAAIAVRNGEWTTASVVVAIAVSEAISNMPLPGFVAVALVQEAPAVRAKLNRMAQLVPLGVDFDLSAPPVDFVLPPDRPQRVPTPRPQRSTLDSLELDDVGVTFDDGTPALCGITLSVRRGELMVVTGPVGSGKTTLLRVLAGLIPIDHGEIRWNGEVIDDPSLFLRPPNCAYVSQTPRLVSGSVQENVSLDHELDVEAALALAELTDEVAGWGGGSAVVGHRGMRLSGGQAQRLATARALATNSELLVLDDLSSALDPVTERQVWASLRAAGHTVIAASHQPAAFAAADRILYLDGGELRALDDSPDRQTHQV